MNFSSNSDKQRLIKKHTPRSKTGRNCLRAFFVGGTLCMAAQGFLALYTYLGVNDKDALTLVSLTFIFLGSLATAVGIFDKIGRFAGAGTLLPITGFSNSITSEAIDAKSEGIILGVGAKIFTVAGPVILYGLISGIIYGCIYALTGVILPYLNM